MNQSEAENNILFLEMQFGKQYPPNARNLLIEQLKPLSEESGKRGVDKLLEQERWLPAPINVVKAINEYEAEQREQIAKHQRIENQQHRTFLDTPQDSEHAHKACLLVKATLAGCGREKTLEGMYHLANLYPKAGWGTAANRLTTIFAEMDKAGVTKVKVAA